MLPTLTDGTVTLRPWRPSDAADLQREVQDPAVVRWMALDVPYPIEVAEAFIAGTPKAWQERTAAHFVITDDSDHLAGYLGVLSVEDRMRVVEFGYWVAAAHRGRGMATEALRLAVDWVKAELAPERLELGMLDGNAASAAVAESAGFVFDRMEPSDKLLDGEPVEERIYVLP
jgi:RimJ/RimL family protein N-acetyltransferase